MSAKATAKSPVKTKPKAATKAVKTTSAQPETPTGLLAHWLQDVSLEVVQPLTAYAAGDREVEFMVRANQVDIPHPTHGKLELRLRAHITTKQGPLVVAEVLYSGVVDKTQSGLVVEDMFKQLYQPARQNLEQVLKLSGHTPPLPEALESATSQA